MAADMNALTKLKELPELHGLHRETAVAIVTHLSPPTHYVLLAASLLLLALGVSAFGQAADDKQATFFMGRVKYSSSDGDALLLTDRKLEAALADDLLPSIRKTFDKVAVRLFSGHKNLFVSDIEVAKS